MKTPLINVEKNGDLSSCRFVYLVAMFGGLALMICSLGTWKTDLNEAAIAQAGKPLVLNAEQVEYASEIIGEIKARLVFRTPDTFKDYALSAPAGFIFNLAHLNPDWLKFPGLVAANQQVVPSVVIDNIDTLSFSMGPPPTALTLNREQIAFVKSKLGATTATAILSSKKALEEYMLNAPAGFGTELVHMNAQWLRFPGLVTDDLHVKKGGPSFRKGGAVSGSVLRNNIDLPS